MMAKREMLASAGRPREEKEEAGKEVEGKGSSKGDPYKWPIQLEEGEGERQMR